jgi:hypothetical protein
VYDFREKLQKAVLDRQCDLRNFVPLPIGRYAFNTLTDKATGLGILIHDWWSIKAELKNYIGVWDSVTQTGAFNATLVFTMTDDFGLDWMDIVQHGTDHMPPTLSWYSTGDRFKAWYILQHYRKAKPFFVQVIQEYNIDESNAPL